MLYFLLTLILIISVLLILIIIIQNPKGGLAANFASNNQILGVRKTADFLEKATWTMGIALLVLSILSSGLYSTRTDESAQTRESKIQKKIEESEMPVIPNIPAPQPNSNSQNNTGQSNQK